MGRFWVGFYFLSLSRLLFCCISFFFIISLFSLFLVICFLFPHFFLLIKRKLVNLICDCKSSCSCCRCCCFEETTGSPWGVEWCSFFCSGSIPRPAVDRLAHHAAPLSPSSTFTAVVCARCNALVLPLRAVWS